jgi:hypothetical protein
VGGLVGSVVGNDVGDTVGLLEVGAALGDLVSTQGLKPILQSPSA